MTKAQMITALKAVVECSKIDAEKCHGDAYFDGKAAAYKEVMAMLDVYFDALNHEKHYFQLRMERDKYVKMRDL